MTTIFTQLVRYTIFTILQRQRRCLFTTKNRFVHREVIFRRSFLIYRNTLRHISRTTVISCACHGCGNSCRSCRNITYRTACFVYRHTTCRRSRCYSICHSRSIVCRHTCCHTSTNRSVCWRIIPTNRNRSVNRNNSTSAHVAGCIFRCLYCTNCICSGSRNTPCQRTTGSCLCVSFCHTTFLELVTCSRLTSV